MISPMRRMMTNIVSKTRNKNMLGEHVADGVILDYSIVSPR